MVKRISDRESDRVPADRDRLFASVRECVAAWQLRGVFLATENPINMFVLEGAEAGPFEDGLQ